MDVPEQLIVALFLGTYATFIALEQLRPARAYPRLPAWRLAGVCFLFFGHMFAGLVALAVPEDWLERHRLFDLTGLGIVGGVVAQYAVHTFLYYWYHRAMHRFDVLWRIHQVHHSPPRYDVSLAYIDHPFDQALQFLWSSVAFTLVFGFDPRAVAIALYLSFLATLLEHSNLRTPTWVGWFTARPEHHSLHHERGVHRGNYSEWPVVWDRLFGTYREPTQERRDVGFDLPWYASLGHMLLMVDVHKPGYGKRRNDIASTSKDTP